MEEETGEVVKLTGASKPVDKRGLRVVRAAYGACQHRTCTYIVDEALAEVVCGDCSAKLDPSWVLRQLCEKESRWRARMEELQALAAAVKDRTRTRCQHCDQMTAINVDGRLKRVRL